MVFKDAVRDVGIARVVQRAGGGACCCIIFSQTPLSRVRIFVARRHVSTTNPRLSWRTRSQAIHTTSQRVHITFLYVPREGEAPDPVETSRSIDAEVSRSQLGVVTHRVAIPHPRKGQERAQQ